MRSAGAAGAAADAKPKNENLGLANPSRRAWVSVCANAPLMPELTQTQLVMVLAGLSGSDPRTVRTFLKTGQVRESVRERIERAQRQWAQMQSSLSPVVKG